MSDWLDTLLGERGSEPAKAEPIAAAPLVHTVWVQIRAPSGRPGDCGAVEAGWYFVQDGAVIMCSDENGKPTGQSERLTTGGNAKAVAGRLRKQAWLREQGSAGAVSARFNRPLGYARSGNA
jgi:hypothetical protein